MKEKIIRCPHNNCNIVVKKETYKVRGEPITIEAHVKACADCHKDIFDINCDTKNLLKAYSLYKRKHNLLTNEEIIAIRKKYKMSQRAFATLLGCTQATIVRYERGDIQEELYNNIIKLLDDPDNVSKLLEQKRDAMNSRDIASIEKAICELQNNEEDMFKNMQNLLGEDFKSEACIFNGFRRFNFNKFKAMVIFFAKQQPSLYKTKLMKLLWYADMLHFKYETTSICGLMYQHLQYGPVPEQYRTLLTIMETMKYINIEEIETENGSTQSIISSDVDDVCLQDLAASELEILKKVSKSFLKYTSKDISKISHEELGYKKTNDRDLISFEYAMGMEY